jgi:hypothetical protein
MPAGISLGLLWRLPFGDNERSGSDLAGAHTLRATTWRSQSHRMVQIGLSQRTQTVQDMER